MTPKDILIILLPILVEGIVIFMFQLYISRKVDRLDKKIEVKNKIIEEYLFEVRDVCELHQKVLHNGVISEAELQTLIDQIGDLYKKYEANKAVLEPCGQAITDYKNAWLRFGMQWNSMYNNSKNMKKDLEESELYCSECAIRLQNKLIAML